MNQQMPINPIKGGQLGYNFLQALENAERETPKFGESRSFKPKLAKKPEVTPDLELKKYKVRTMMLIEMDCETVDAAETADSFLEGLSFTGGTDVKKVNSVIYPISIECIDAKMKK